MTNSSSVLETEGTSSKTKSTKLAPPSQITAMSDQSLKAFTLNNLNLTKALTNMKKKQKSKYRLCLDGALIYSVDLF